MDRPIDEIIEKLENFLEYRLKECDPKEWKNYETYAKIVSDLCTTIDTLKYYFN